MGIMNKPLLKKTNRRYDRQEVLDAYFAMEKHGLVFEDSIKLGISVCTLRKILMEAGVPFLKYPKKNRRGEPSKLSPTSIELKQAKEKSALSKILKLKEEIKDEYGKYVYTEEIKKQVFKEVEELLQYLSNSN